jgi:glucokinase
VSPLRVGVDIGGTTIKAIAMSNGAIVDRTSEPTSREGLQAIRVQVPALVERLVGETGDDPRIGIVVPGLVDDATGKSLWSANLGWRDLDVVGEVSGRVRGHIVAGHDVRAGLLGESRHGAGRGWDDLLFVPLGTGLASALMLGGRVVSAGPWTGEVGHVLVDAEGPRCGCGRQGCLEACTGARAIQERWRTMTGQEASAEEIAHNVLKGDLRARRIWDDAIEELARALALIIAATGVGRVIVGGGLSRAGGVLLDPLSVAISRRIPEGMPCEVVLAELGQWAGAIGAAVLADESRSDGLRGGHA